MTKIDEQMNSWHYRPVDDGSGRDRWMYVQ